jgi:hypothetical protein
LSQRIVLFIVSQFLLWDPLNNIAVRCVNIWHRSDSCCGYLVGMHEVRRIFRALISTLGPASACAPYIAHTISKLTSTHFIVHAVIKASEQEIFRLVPSRGF